EPEIASIGLTSNDVRRLRLRAKVVTASVKVAPRSQIENQFDGFIKLIVDSKSKAVLGATIVAPRAAEIVHEIAVIMHTKMPVDQIQNIYHVFPTWSELVQIAAQKLH